MKLSDSVNGLQHIGIPVKDLKESVAYYEALGFKNIYETQNNGQNVAFVQLGELIIEFYDNTYLAEKSGAINHVALNSTDIDASYAACKELGLTFLEDITSLPFWANGIKYFSVVGPSKEVIEVCQKL